MHNKIWKIIFLFFIFIHQNIYAQINNETQKIQNIDALFFADNIKEEIPADIVNELEKVPTSEIDDAIITYLIGTGKYQNVLVKELYNKELKKNIYLITAHYTKKIQNIIFEGVSTAEQSASQKNLTLQAGKIFKESLVADDIKKIEKNIQTKGYPNAHVTGYKVKPISNYLVNLVYTVEKGEPCQIEQVVIENSNANILNFINLPIETGSICDINAIYDKLYQIKSDYWKQGYLTAQTKIKEMLYSTDKQRAKLVLIMDKGPKTIVQIQDKKNNSLSLDFLNTKQSALTYSDVLLSSDATLNTSLVNYYQNLGYPFVNVTGPEHIQKKNGDTILQFTVDRKNFVKIGDVFFIGNLPDSKENILKELQLESGLFSGDIPFVQSELAVYRDQLRNIFFKHGYADAQIPVPDFSFSPDEKQVSLVFNITPGYKYIIAGIKLNNLPEGFSLRKKHLEHILPLGAPVNAENKQAYVDELRTQLLNHGYLYAQIQLEQNVQQISLGTKFVTLNANIDAGPIVTVGKIYVQGDTFNKEKTIISISELETGDIFTQHLLDRAHNQLMRHELFSSASVEPLEPEAITRKDTVLDVVIRANAKTGFLLSLSPGWGSLRGYRFSTDYSLYKITDNGLRLISSAGVSQEKQQSSFASADTKQILGEQLNVGLTEPLFKLGPIYTPFDMSSIAGYQVTAETLTNREYQTLKFISEWKPAFFDYNWTFTSTLIHEKSISTSSESAVVQAIDSPSLVIREWLNSFSIDTRNNPAWPTSGGLFSFGFGMARFGLGSDVQYNRYLPKVNFYFPIYKKLSGAILTGGVFVSDTTNRDGETVTPPASRRATLTDDALIRGFPETYGATAPGPLLWIHYSPNSLGTNCNTQLASVGGTNMVYAKAEGRYRFNDTFGMVAFLDSGESYLTPKEVSQVNNQIQGQINPTATPITGQCTVDSASLIAPDSPKFNNTNFLEEYWREAYVSTGLGLRVILGNIASISLDYGYPLKDPSQHDDNCMSPSDATNVTGSGGKPPSAPTCVSRIQNSSYDLKFYNIQFKGALHLGIGAQF